MRKRILLALLAITVLLSAPLHAQPGSATSGSGKDINGIYKNEKFELKIENFNQQTSSFSFTLNSVKSSGCNLAIKGIANRLKVNLSSPNAIRYEFVNPNGGKYYFTVFTADKTTVDIMRSGDGDNAANSCLPEKSISKVSFEGTE